MIYAIIGSTNLNTSQVKKWVFEKLDYFTDISYIVSGGAIGIDSIAIKYAIEKNIEYTIFKPDWDEFNKFAGFMRNKKIIANSEKTIAFWDGTSPGTKDSINFSKSVNHETIVFVYNRTKTTKLDLW